MTCKDWAVCGIPDGIWTGDDLGAKVPKLEQARTNVEVVRDVF